MADHRDTSWRVRLGAGAAACRRPARSLAAAPRRPSNAGWMQAASAQSHARAAARGARWSGVDQIVWKLILAFVVALVLAPGLAAAASCDVALDRNGAAALEQQAGRLRSQVIRAVIPVVRDQREALAAEDASSQVRALNEQLGLQELAISLAEVRSTLATTATLAEAQLAMHVDSDRSVLRRMIRRLAPSAVEAASNALTASDEVASSTQRRSVVTLAADIRAFLARAHDAFQACVDPATITF